VIDSDLGGDEYSRTMMFKSIELSGEEKWAKTKR
jgi:hypothetical protein